MFELIARSNTPPRRLLQQRGIGVGSSEASRALAGAANERSSSPSLTNIDLSPTLTRQDNQKYSGTTTPKLLPRKEAPKVDLKLELELEIDAVMPPPTPILDDELTPTKFRLSRGNTLIGFPESTSEPATNLSGSLTQLATRRPSSPTSLYSNPAVTSGTDSISGSISSSGGGGGGNGKIQPTKRRQRSSISSMLSFKSNNRSASALGTYDNNNTSDNLPPPRSHSPFSPLSLTSSIASTDSNSGPFNNNLNHPPRPSSAIDQSFPSTSQLSSKSKSKSSTSKSGSLLSRQFSKLRGNRDTGNSNFSFGAGPLPKSSTSELMSHKDSNSSISSLNSVSGSTSSISKNAGRRFVEKFGMSKTTSNKSSSSGTAVGISTDSIRNATAITNDSRNYEDYEREGEEDQPPRPSSRVGKFLKHPLGMKLPQARKSEDLLSRNEREQESDIDGGNLLSARRSFDLLTQRQTIPRRPSIDNLLVCLFSSYGFRMKLTSLCFL